MMTHLLVRHLMIVTLVSLLSAPVVYADEDDIRQLRQDIDAIKADTETIKRQLAEVQRFLAQRVVQADQGPVTLTVGDGPSLGPSDAPVTIVEFSDYECPFCRRYFTSTFQELKAAYIDTRKVRYFFRDFPLEKIHPYARKAAEAAHCAGDQGKFWDMHDTIFQNQSALQTDSLRHFARTMELDLDIFNACLDEGKYAKRVEADVAAGSAVGVTGTPGFFIGKTKPDGTMLATFVKGARPAAAFSQVIDRLLEEKTE